MQTVPHLFRATRSAALTSHQRCQPFLKFVVVVVIIIAVVGVGVGVGVVGAVSVVGVVVGVPVFIIVVVVVLIVVVVVVFVFVVVVVADIVVVPGTVSRYRYRYLVMRRHLLSTERKCTSVINFVLYVKKLLSMLLYIGIYEHTMGKRGQRG